MLLLKTWGPVTEVSSRRYMQMGALQVMCTWIFSLVGVCCSLQAGILYCWNYMSCTYWHGLVVRLGEVEFPTWVQTGPKGVLPKILKFWDIIITSLLHHNYNFIIYIIITSLLRHYYIVITHCYNFIITNYYIIITSLLHHYHIIITTLLHHYYSKLQFHFLQIITSLLCYSYIIIASLLLKITYSLLHHYSVIISSLLHHYYVIITNSLLHIITSL